PERRLDGTHHLLAEIVFAQHELDEMRAHGKDTEPEAAGSRSGKPGRIAREVAVDHGDFADVATLQRRPAEAMVPAFGEPEAAAIRRDRQPMRIVEPIEQHPRLGKPRSAGDEAPHLVLLHEIDAPVLWHVPAAAVAGKDAAVAAHDD